MNKIEASSLSLLTKNESFNESYLLYNEFVTGRYRNLTSIEQDTIKKATSFLKTYAGESETGFMDFMHFSRQTCSNQYLHIQFKEKSLAWNEANHKISRMTISQPTDFGRCCTMQPHLMMSDMDKPPDNFSEIFESINPKAENGESNAVIMLIDAETFNYVDKTKHGMGFKVTFGQFGDKPFMQDSSKLIPVGHEVQITLNPLLNEITDYAVNTFTPEERKCYQDSEIDPPFLSKKFGYIYSKSTCTYNNLIYDIILKCDCYPSFFVTRLFNKLAESLNSCSGEKLICANSITGHLQVENDDLKDLKSSNNGSNKMHMNEGFAKLRCLPACDSQQNNFQLSTVPFPAKNIFFYQDYFCHTASHILQKTCAIEHRRYFLEKMYPTLCSVLESFERFFDNNSMCSEWPNTYFKLHDEINATLYHEVSKYGRDNLVLVNYFIEGEDITKIVSDVEMTFTDFVANAGGLLGLWLGFSFFSLVEILYWIIICCKCRK